MLLGISWENWMKCLHWKQQDMRADTEACTTATWSWTKKKKKLEHLNHVLKRKQQPKQIKTQRKQKTQNDTNATTLSSNIAQEINIECDTSIGQSNINNIQHHDNIETVSSTANTHNFQQDENIQNEETENAVLLNEQQLGTEALQKRTKKTRTPLRKFWLAEQTYQYRARKKNNRLTKWYGNGK